MAAPPPPPPSIRAPPPFLGKNAKVATNLEIKCLKPVVVSRKPMKNVFWTRIQSTDMAHKANFDKTVWAKIEKEGTYLSNKLEPNQEDLLVDLFGQESVLKDSSSNLNGNKGLSDSGKISGSNTALPNTSSCNSKEAVITVLESKRSLDINVTLKSFKLEVGDIKSALATLNFKLLTDDLIKKLYVIKPTAEETKGIKDAVNAMIESNPDKPYTMNVPEKFCLEMSTIPCLEEKLWCLLFKNNFHEVVSSLKNIIRLFQSYVEILLTNKDINTFLSILLNLGNYMNASNKSRSQADGFNLETLNNIRGIKSNTQNMNLLQFAVNFQIQRLLKQSFYKNLANGHQLKEIDGNFGNNGDADKSFTLFESKTLPDLVLDSLLPVCTECPMPEPTAFRDLCHVNFDEINQSIEEIAQSLKKFDQKYGVICDSSLEADAKSYIIYLKELQNNVTIEFESLKKSFEEMKNKYTQVTQYFCWKTTKMDKAGEFFKVWQDFFQDYRDMWNLEIQKLNKSAKSRNNACQSDNAKIKRLNTVLRKK